MTKKFFLSRKWLMVAGILFLSAACQPKADPSQQRDSSREQYGRSSQSSDGRSSQKDEGCGSAPCPCPAECPKKAECKDKCPCPTKGCATPCPPKKECKEACPCPAPCPKKGCKDKCPCPKKDCKSCSADPVQKAEGALTQGNVITETPVSAAKKTVESAQL